MDPISEAVKQSINLREEREKWLARAEEQYSELEQFGGGCPNEKHALLILAAAQLLGSMKYRD